MIRILVFVVTLGLGSAVSAQICGTPGDVMMERMRENKLAMVAHQRGAVKYVPVTFHLVAASNGTGRVEEENVLKQVLNLNTQYADQEVIYYIDRFNYFDSDVVFNTPFTTAGRQQMNLRRDNNSINVFIVNSADDGNSPGVTVAYYDPQNDWVVANKSKINGAANTLSHELGHFFSLPHPFEGWECFPYTMADYGNPVTRDNTLPCESGGGSKLIELHDRSNCNTAGDEICDTPEDFNLGLLFQNNCNENVLIKDKNNEVIKPMTNNFMSYYNDCADYEFTQTQKDLMNTDFFTFRRAYIRTGLIPNTTPVPGPVTYISPINGEESNGITNIVLDWEDYPGANKYLVTYDRFSTFTFNPVKAIATSSKYTITATLTEGITYYWKVWPYNESQTGAMYGPTQNFKVGTGTAVNEIHDIQDYALTPNPVLDHVNPSLTLFSNKAFKANLKLIDASGRVLTQENISIPTGPSQYPIDVLEIPAGIYFVMLDSDQGRLVERLFVLE